MTASRKLIVNADDFGLDPAINLGIAQAHEQGILTSASLMVRGPSATEAAHYGRINPDLSVGLHCDFGEWTYRSDNWETVYEVVDIHDEPAVRSELVNQLAEFRRLMGCDPTHLDSHQHVHRSEPVRSVLLRLANELQIPLRHFCDRVQYCGEFYGQSAKNEPWHQAIQVPAMILLLERVPPGITELACHPSAGELNSPYNLERRIELATLCDPRVRLVICEQGIELCSFRSIDL